MKILLTGAGGGLGGELSAVFTDDDVVALNRAELDITDRHAIQAAFERWRPEAVIHAAAYTKVDQAEAEPEIAAAINVQGTANVAEAARELDSMLVYPSTDYIFDGRKMSPYVEEDTPNPLSVYGRSKLEGEAAARRNPQTFVLRTSWLYSHGGKSFVNTMRRLFAEKERLNIVDDEISSPTYARDFARALRQLLPTNLYGTYHVANVGETSWYGYAGEIARRTNATVNLEPTTAAAYGLAAQRPPYSVLNTAKLNTLGITLPTWQDGLKSFFQDSA